jgi:hypothetical protein
LVLGLVAGWAVGCTQWGAIKPTPESAEPVDTEEASYEINPSSDTSDVSSCGLTMLAGAERDSAIQAALNHAKVKSIQQELSSRGFIVDSAGALVFSIEGEKLVYLPAGESAGIVYETYLNQGYAVGLIREEEKTINIRPDRGVRHITGFDPKTRGKLLKSLRSQKQIKTLEKNLKKQNQRLDWNRSVLLVETENSHATVGLALQETNSAKAAWFGYRVEALMKGKKLVVQNVAAETCGSMAALEDASTQPAGDAKPQTEHFGNPVPSGTINQDQICVSSWGYSYKCFSTTPAFGISGVTTSPLVTFVGQSVQTTMTIWNYSAKTMSGTATATAAPFSIVSGGTFTLAPGQPHQIVVKFSPTAAGTFTGAVRLVSGSSFQNVSVTGWTISVSPLTLDFNALFHANPPTSNPVNLNGSNSTSQVLELVIRNDGPPQIAFQANAVTIQVNTLAPYSLSQTSQPFTLGAGYSMPIKVRFNPSGSGSFPGSIVVKNGSSMLSVPVAGIAHKVAVTPNGLNVGTIVGSPTTRKLTIRNEGITTFTTSVKTNAPFSTVSPSTAFTLAPTQSLDVAVQFSPTEAEIYSTDLILSNVTSTISIPLKGRGYTFEQVWESGTDAYKELNKHPDLYNVLYTEDASLGLNLILAGIDGLDLNRANTFRSAALQFIKDKSLPTIETWEGLQILATIPASNLFNWIRTLVNADRNGNFESEYLRLLSLGLATYEKALSLVLHIDLAGAKSFIQSTVRSISAQPVLPDGHEIIYEIIRLRMIWFLTEVNDRYWQRADAEKFANEFIQKLQSAVNGWINAGFLSDSTPFPFSFGISSASEFLTTFEIFMFKIYVSGGNLDKVDLLDACSRNCEIMQSIQGLIIWNNASLGNREKAFGTLKVAMNASVTGSWEILGFIGSDGKLLSGNMTASQALQIEAVFTVEFLKKGVLDPDKSFLAITGGHHCGGISCASPSVEQYVKDWLQEAVQLAKERTEGDQRVVVFSFTRDGALVSISGLISALFTVFANETEVVVMVTWERNGTVFFACVSKACEGLSDKQKKDIACQHATGDPNCKGKQVAEVRKGEEAPPGSTIAESPPKGVIRVWPNPEADVPACTGASSKMGC